MGLRTALEQSKILTFVTLAAFAWLFFTLLTVVRDVRWLELASSNYIGYSAAGGALGAIVLLIMLGILVTLYGGVSESDPAPSNWPPSE